MTIDEAIKHCEEQANLLEESAAGCDMMDKVEKEIAYRSGKCAEEHRQLAEWLKELKAYREAREEIGRLPIVWEEGAGIQKCIDILDEHLKEVNADDD